ncbi:hypothetical protein PhCBS80983_g06273 [Powellomyces hirtus]|uniref:Uncharacterized protein n=1 Tax=Powellomyces hirtus TaxID=109895 RepID=A0A507DPU1_9FUNG|nr:hypothetical protein PhCBS80983_g06273 [Powellomyces hirtus]
MTYVVDPFFKDTNRRVGSIPYMKMMKKVVSEAFNRCGWSQARKTALLELQDPGRPHMNIYMNHLQEKNHQSAQKRIATLGAEKIKTIAQKAAKTRKRNRAEKDAAFERYMEAMRRKREEAAAKRKEVAAKKKEEERMKLVKSCISVKKTSLKTIKYDKETYHFNPKQTIRTPDGIRKLFEDLIAEASKGLVEGDRVQITIAHSQLFAGYWSSGVTPINSLTTDSILDEISSILQSSEIAVIDSNMIFEVQRYVAPKGGAFTNYYDYTSATAKKAVIVVKNNGVDCGMRAVAIAIASVTMDKKSNDYKYIKEQRKPLDQLVQKYYKGSRIAQGTKMTFELFKNLVSYLKRNIVIVDLESGGKAYMVTGKNDEKFDLEPVAILRRNDHFDCLTKISAFYNCSYFCYTCMKGYKDQRQTQVHEG